VAGVSLCVRECAPVLVHGVEKLFIHRWWTTQGSDSGFSAARLGETHRLVHR
jgi:hypothetical protein